MPGLQYDMVVSPDEQPETPRSHNILVRIRVKSEVNVDDQVIHTGLLHQVELVWS